MLELWALLDITQMRLSRQGPMTSLLDKLIERWLDNPRSDTVTFVVGVSVYFLFWSLLAIAGITAVLMPIWTWKAS